MIFVQSIFKTRETIMIGHRSKFFKEIRIVNFKYGWKTQDLN